MMNVYGREMTVAEWAALHAARGYVCCCPPDVALADCAPCTARTEQLAATFRARLDQLRAEVEQIDRAEQLAAGKWTPAGALEVRLS